MKFKPKKKIRTIKSEYFTCGIDGHFHKTERVAINCYKKRGTGGQTCASHREKCIAAIDMYLANKTYAEIGRQLGVSGDAAKYTICKAVEIVYAHDDHLITLPDGTIGKLCWTRTAYGEDGGRSRWGHKLYTKHVSNYTKCIRRDQIKPLADKDKARYPEFLHWHLKRTLDGGFVPLCEMTEAQIDAIPKTMT